MNRPRFEILFLVALSFLSITALKVFPQFDGFSSDSFKGLLLDSTTALETKEKIGQPDISRTNVGLELDYGANWFKHWFGTNLKEKSFTRLIYKNLGEYKEVNLFFRDDKLVWVRADLVNPFDDDNPFLSANELETVFDVEFKTFRWAFGRKLPPIDEFRSKPDHKLEKDAPFYYLRIGLTDRSVVSNFVNNNNENLTRGFLARRFSLSRKKWEEINARGSLPGYVSSIHIISRSLVPQ